MDEGIQYLRELAVLEVIYNDLDHGEVSKNLEDVLCTWAMRRKVIQSAPASYSNSLATMYCPDMDTPTVERLSSWLQNFEENLCPTSSLQASTLAVRSAPRSQSPPVLVRGKGSPRQMPHGALWFFLRDQGEDMREWDGEPTFKLEARVHELRGKTAVKKGPPKKAVSIVAVETQEGNQRSPRHRRTEIISLDSSEETFGLALQGSDSEYSHQEQE
ncbi:glycine dehydrogenase mitochondrial-like [Limosa lapponica baueri]|uniref:Glycine dehydrogenase mitochondrial-like n=1 Tax=Limosa lapponica baueri TaxID=1758121 RepID=A0A2I0TD76_LIMLA|nr:glycine dehydrogenase mitochondrial-like [Limosa lapponica baueri]